MNPDVAEGRRELEQAAGRRCTVAAGIVDPLEMLIVANPTPRACNHTHIHTPVLKGRVSQWRSENFWGREGVEVEETGAARPLV